MGDRMADRREEPRRRGAQAERPSGERACEPRQRACARRFAAAADERHAPVSGEQLRIRCAPRDEHRGGASRKEREPDLFLRRAPRAPRREALGIAAPSRAALHAERATPALGTARPADGRAELHHRLVVIPRAAWIKRLLGRRAERAAHARALRIAGESEHSTENPLDVAIQDRERQAEGDAADGSRGVGADPGELQQCLERPRQLARVLGDDSLRGTMEVPAARVVAEPCPVAHHLLFFRGGERRRIGEASQKSLVVGDHRAGARLLEHDLGDPDCIGIGAAPPGKFALASAEPAAQSLARAAPVQIGGLHGVRSVHRTRAEINLARCGTGLGSRMLLVMSNSFGEFFRITTWGESHGPGIGVVVDGVPPGVEVGRDEIAAALERRRPGGALASARQEPDAVEILSGIHEGRTLGSPIALWIPNRDARPADYETLKEIYRPGHADFTTEARYGRRDARGGGRASARETAARVAAGAIAEALLASEHAIEIVAWVERVAEIEARIDPAGVTRAAVDASPVRCPDPATSRQMEELVAAARDDGDSVGGTVAVVARGVPAGWGDPVFGKLKALLANAFLSLPAAVAFEVGDGFAATRRRGSENNDPYVARAGGGIGTETNRSGGILGGISSGEPILARVGFKPTSTIRKTQSTVDRSGRQVEFEGRGRHDPCVLPRAVPVVEAMMSLVLVDRMLCRRAAPPGRREG